MRKKLALILMSLSMGVFASEMTLEEVIDISLKNNFSLKKQDISIENSKIATKNHYKSMYLPSINFGAEGEIAEVQDKGVGPKSISVKLDLDVWGQQRNQYRIMKNSLRIAELNREKSEYSLEEQVIRTYFSYLAAVKNMEYTKSTVETLARQRSKLDRMLNGGNLISKNELLKIEIELEENNLNYSTQLYNSTVLKQQLFMLMGKGLDQDIDFKDVDISSLKIEGDFSNLKSVEQKALEESTESEITRLQIENANYQNKIAKAELYPKFYMKPEYKFEDAGYDKKGARLTFGVSWAFQWGNTLNNIEVSNNNLEVAKLGYEEKVMQLTLQARGMYENLKRAKIAYDINSKKIELMNENLKLDTRRFENGLMGSRDYLDSMNGLVQAEENQYIYQQEIFLLKLALRNLLK